MIYFTYLSRFIHQDKSNLLLYNILGMTNVNLFNECWVKCIHISFSRFLIGLNKLVLAVFELRMRSDTSRVIQEIENGIVSCS